MHHFCLYEAIFLKLEKGVVLICILLYERDFSIMNKAS